MAKYVLGKKQSSKNEDFVKAWKNGYIVGTGVWPARQWVGTTQNGWQELWDINPSMVRDAVPYIASAKDFINTKK